MLAGAHDLLEPFEDQVIEHLKTAAPVAHADESGVRVAGKLHWLHVMCTHLVTFYGIHAKRGRIAMDTLTILPAFHGTLVTDALKRRLALSPHKGPPDIFGVPADLQPST